MNRLIISTIGTSLATNVLRKLNNSEAELTEARKQLFVDLPWDGEVDKLKKVIDGYLSDTHSEHKNKKAWAELSAEINSLNALKVNDNDRLVFIATDTAQSKLVCKILTDIVSSLYGIKQNQIETKRIEGLQVQDAKKIREHGFKNLITATQRIIEDNRYKGETIINVTGGFKGVIPFITIMGMLYKIKTVYLFERSNQLIVLPPLPFSFDLELFERVRPALEYIEQETAVPEEVYLSKIVDFTEEQRDLYLSFVEPTDESNREVTLSPLAFSLLAVEKNAQMPKVAESVLEKLNNINDQARQRLEIIIEKSGSPLWRSQKKHSFSATDLTVLKPGNTPERIAGYVENNVFHVAVVFDDHDEYEKKLGNYQKVNFDNETFVEWSH